MAIQSAVLVVEDDEDLRDMVELVLVSEGFEVRTAANGEQALTILVAWRPDVIVLDLSMPEMNGAVFRRIQLAQPHLADIPVILFTAALRGSDRAAELRAAAFLPKPCDLDALVRTVSRVAAQAQTMHGGDDAAL